MSLSFNWQGVKGSQVYLSRNPIETLKALERLSEGFTVDYSISEDGSLMAVIIMPEGLSDDIREETETRYTQALSELDFIGNPESREALCDMETWRN